MDRNTIIIGNQHVYVSFLIGEDPHSPPDAPVLNRFYFHKPWSELHPKPTGCLVIRLPGHDREYTYFPILPFDITRDGHLAEFVSWNPVPGATWAADGSPANIRMLWLLATLTPESDEVDGYEIGKFTRYGLHLRNQESDARAEEARIGARLEQMMADRPLPPSPNLNQEELCTHMDAIFMLHIGRIHSRLGRLLHETGSDSDPPLSPAVVSSPKVGKQNQRGGGKQQRGGGASRGTSGPSLSRAPPLTHQQRYSNGNNGGNGYAGNHSPSYPPSSGGRHGARDPKRKRGTSESDSSMQPLDDFEDDRGSSTSTPTTSGYLRDGTRGSSYSRDPLPFPKSKQRTGN